MFVLIKGNTFLSSELRAVLHSGSVLQWGALGILSDSPCSYAFPPNPLLFVYSPKPCSLGDLVCECAWMSPGRWPSPALTLGPLAPAGGPRSRVRRLSLRLDALSSQVQRLSRERGSTPSPQQDLTQLLLRYHYLPRSPQQPLYMRTFS